MYCTYVPTYSYENITVKELTRRYDCTYLIVGDRVRLFNWWQIGAKNNGTGGGKQPSNGEVQ